MRKIGFVDHYIDEWHANNYPAWIRESSFGGAFVLSLVNSFKRVISPGLVLAFAAIEGVALGAFSKAFEAWYGGTSGALTSP